MNTLHLQKLNNLITNNTNIFSSALEVKNANSTRAAIKMNTDCISSEELLQLIATFQADGYSVQVFGDYLALEMEVQNA